MFIRFVHSVKFYTCFRSPSVTGLLGSPLLRCSLYLPPSFVANSTSLLSLYTGRSDSLTPSTSSGLSTPVSVNSPARFNAGTGLGGLTGSSSGLGRSTSATSLSSAAARAAEVVIGGLESNGSGKFVHSWNRREWILIA